MYVQCQPSDKAVYCKLRVSMTWTKEPSDKAVYCQLRVSILPKKIIKLHVLCQPLDKAVTCKLQVSMTWALEPSDKAVTANSESASNVGKTKTKSQTRGRDQRHLARTTQQTKFSSSGLLLVPSYGQRHQHCLQI